MRLFRDILDIARGDISALTQVPIHTRRPSPIIFPWETSELVGTLPKSPQERIYRVLSHAPPTDNPGAPQVFYVPLSKSTADPRDPRNRHPSANAPDGPKKRQYKAEHDSKQSARAVIPSLTLLRKKATKKADTQARATTNQTMKPKMANPSRLKQPG